MSFLQLSNLTIGYAEHKAPKVIQSGLNLSAEKGELIALIGKNGCGKSTLLRSIACLQPVLEGKIFLQGENILEITPKQRARLISVSLTDHQSVASFTVKELISIGRDPYTGWLGSLSAEDERIIAEAIEITYLSSFENRNIHELSDGERQRVFFARALAQDTPVILLDEPTSHLDLPNRINILLLLQKLAREMDKTIFISTHELETAMQVADKIWLMKKNKGVTVGTPEDMVLNGDFDTVFHHPSYEFDKEYGSFVVQKQLDKSVSTRVKNPNGLMARWTTKALSRKGYKIVENSPIEVFIDEENRKWTISNKVQLEEAHTINEMLQKLSVFDT